MGKLNKKSNLEGSESGKAPESFAQRILRLQGWKEGQGLGKTSQGIPEPLRPHLKFDTTGMGHDPAKEFTNHWWNDAYNKAANSIQILTDEENIQSPSVSTSPVEKETKRSKKKMYGGFVKTATLTNTGALLVEEPEELPESIPTPNSNPESIKILSDEEMFKACKGLTAHKGARHGHKMTAKLDRIAEMEKKLIEEMMKKSKSDKTKKEKKNSSVKNRNQGKCLKK